MNRHVQRSGCLRPSNLPPAKQKSSKATLTRGKVYGDSTARIRRRSKALSARIKTEIDKFGAMFGDEVPWVEEEIRRAKEHVDEIVDQVEEHCQYLDEPYFEGQG